MHADALSPALPSSPKRWLLVALFLLFAVLGVQHALKVAENRSAFLRWRPQVVELENGVDIYRQYNYPNPPIMALFLMPLAKLPPSAGAMGWFYLKVGMTLLALLWVFRLVEQPGRPLPLWAKALTLLLSLRPIMGDLNHGNVNLLILFLVVAMLYAYHQRHDLTSGVLLGLAIACKVTPALFVPYFLWKRSWKVLAGCVAGLALFLWPGVVPGALLGWQRNHELVLSWTDQMIKPYLIEGKVTSDHYNQSLPGLFYRLTTESPSFTVFDFEEDRYLPVDYHNLISLDPQLVRKVIQGCMLLFVGLVLWTCRTPTEPRHGWRLAAEFSIVVLGMLLFCERTWKHHCVTLLVPFAVLAYYLSVCRPRRALQVYLIGTLVVVELLMALTSTTLLEKGLAKEAQVYGAYVWAYLLMVAALVILLRRSDKSLYLEPRPAQSDSPCR